MNRQYQELSTSALQVVVGAHVLRASEDSQQRYSVKRAVKHELYVPTRTKYDIMVLQLSSRIKFNKKVKPICVDDSTFRPGTSCRVTGWGSTNPDTKRNRLTAHTRHTLANRRIHCTPDNILYNLSFILLPLLTIPTPRVMKSMASSSCPYLRDILTDFQNSLTGRFNRKFVIKFY